MNKTTFESVDAYIASFPQATQKLLTKIRKVIKQAAPKAEEGIGYNMPAYKLHGPLVYFGAAKTHIGFYPTPSGVEAFKDELKDYATSKGAIQFPLQKDIPVALVKQIVQFRVAENEEKAITKKKK